MGIQEMWFKVAVALATPIVTPFFTVDVTVPVLGVPVNVIIGACAGAVSGIALAPPEESRSVLFKTALVSVVFAFTFAALTEGALRYMFDVVVDTKYVSAFAVLLGLLGRVVVPAVLNRLPDWMDRLPFIGSNKTPKGE